MAPNPNTPGPHKNLLGRRIADGRLELVSVLGLGAYGVVYLARDLKHPNHQQPFASSSSSALPSSLAGGAGSAATGFYAVKCLSKVGLDARQRSFQRREIMLHTIASNHSSVVTLHRVIDNPNDPCIYVILDYCPDGDLFSMITEHQRYMVTPAETAHDIEQAAVEAAHAAGVHPDDYIMQNQDALRQRLVEDRLRYKTERAAMDVVIKKVFCQILDAVEFCHSYGIYHRDLKPENILCLQAGAKVVLADFGLATGEKASSDFGCGSTFYMGPECQGGITTRLTEYSTAANDIWSLGVILVNLVCGRNPWKQACTGDETFREYLRRPNFLMQILPISEEANEILKRIFTVRPEWRISTADLRQMILSAKSFTVTDEEMKRREKEAREAAIQARAQQKAAAAAAAAATAAAAAAKQQQYLREQQQLAKAQQARAEQFYARQHQAMAAAQRGLDSPVQVHNALYAEAYDDAENAEPETLENARTDSSRSSGDRYDSSGNSSQASYTMACSSSSSAPTSPESATADWSAQPSVADASGLAEHSSLDCSSSQSGDSASSRRSSFSYTGLPPTPRFATSNSVFGSPTSPRNRPNSVVIEEQDPVLSTKKSLGSLGQLALKGTAFARKAFPSTFVVDERRRRSSALCE